MSNMSDDEMSLYSAAATVANSDALHFPPDLDESEDFENATSIQDFESEKTIAGDQHEIPKKYSLPPSTSSEKNKNRKRKPSEEGSEDVEFEPTIEMMVHDFDDEKTIEEEEKRAMEENESYQHEVESLQKESEMPLEELMKLYAAPPPLEIPPKSRKKKSSKGDSNPLHHAKKARKRAAAAAAAALSANLSSPQNQSNEQIPDTSSETEKEDSVGPVSSTTQDIPCKESENPSLLATIAVEEDVEDEEDDGDYSPEDETVDNQDDDDTKKVKIGCEYQANIPDGLCIYDDVLPYNNEDKLVWCPFAIDDKSIENYLDNYREIDKIQQQQLENEKNLKEKEKNSGENSSEDKNLPTSTTEDIFESVQLTYDTSKHQHLRSSTSQNLRDDEQALYLLLQCGFNFEEALRRKKVNSCCSFPFSSPMSSWSEEECRSFENGMRLNGKNFYIIAKTKTTTRSVSEICEFYYNWKKTTRYDAFVSKQNGNGSGEDKKSVNNFRKSNASVTDYMDKFLDEDSSASDNMLNGGDGSEKVFNLRKRRGSSVSSASSDNNNGHLKRSEGSTRTSGRTTLLPRK